MKARVCNGKPGVGGGGLVPNGKFQSLRHTASKAAQPVVVLASLASFLL